MDSSDNPPAYRSSRQCLLHSRRQRHGRATNAHRRGTTTPNHPHCDSHCYDSAHGTRNCYPDSNPFTVAYRYTDTDTDSDADALNLIRFRHMDSRCGNCARNLP
jgi:hypothetical protein